MVDDVRQLFTQYYWQLVRWFFRRHKDQFVSEELAQDVFDRYIRLRERDPDQPGRYLFTIAKRLDIDTRGRIPIKRRVEMSSIEDTDGPIPDGPTVPDELDSAVLSEQLSAAIATLPEDECRAITDYRHGYSDKEIAQRQGCMETVARRRIESAKRALKRILLPTESRSDES